MMAFKIFKKIVLNVAHVLELSVLVTDDGLFVILSFIAGWSAEVVDELTRRLVVHLTQMVLADGHNRHATDHHEDAFIRTKKKI